MQVQGCLAVVTGAGAGLGREIALGLGSSGARVLCADRDAAAAEETLALLAATGGTGTAVRIDVSRDDERLRLAAVARELGGADLLVNNAGGWTPGAQYPDADPDDWGTTLDLNLRAPMRLTQLFLDGLDHRERRSEPGAVVNVSSSAALGSAAYASPEYAAAKAGLIRFTTAMAGPGVAARARVTAVVPGWIGLPRAHEQWAALSDAERAKQPGLVPPGDVVAIVLRLLAHGSPGEVVELLAPT